MCRSPYLSRELERYFPEAVRTRFARAISRHRLRREIIATATTNSLVNRMGPTFRDPRPGANRCRPGPRGARLHGGARSVRDARAVVADRGTRRPGVGADAVHHAVRDRAPAAPPYLLAADAPAALSVEGAVAEPARSNPRGRPSVPKPSPANGARVSMRWFARYARRRSSGPMLASTHGAAGRAEQRPRPGRAGRRGQCRGHRCRAGVLWPGRAPRPGLDSCAGRRRLQIDGNWQAVARSGFA